jgi:hypothetical protein
VFQLHFEETGFDGGGRIVKSQQVGESVRVTLGF